MMIVGYCLSSQAGKGVLWNLVNGVSRAVVILFGPDIDDDAVSGFGGSLVLAKEPSFDVLFSPSVDMTSLIK